MESNRIRKPRGGASTPNLVDYDKARRGFSWESARSALDGLPGGRGLNIAHEAVDRQATGVRAQRVALRCLARDGSTRDVSYAELGGLTSRFANALQDLDVARGDRVFLLAGRVQALYVAALGTLKRGAVCCPLFAAFGPEPIRTRLALGQGKVLATTDVLYHKRVKALRAGLPELAHVILIDAPPGGPREPWVHALTDLLGQASEHWTIPPSGPEDVALLHAWPT